MSLAFFIADMRTISGVLLLRSNDFQTMTWEWRPILENYR